MDVAGLARRLADLLYPPRCLACREPTETPHGLCAACWRETGFAAGAVCDACGAPLADSGLAGARPLCGDCRARPPGWDRGRAALLYEGTGRRLVLLLKHGDRPDLARPLAGLMAAAGRDLLGPGTLLVPVPLHWRRLVRRRYNQSAEIARALADRTGLGWAPELLRRVRPTPSQEGRGREARQANVAGAFAVPPGRSGRVRGARLLLVDDVLTTGATLSAAAAALRAAGAARVDVLVAARAGRADGDGLRPPPASLYSAGSRAGGQAAAPRGDGA